MEGMSERAAIFFHFIAPPSISHSLHLLTLSGFGKMQYQQRTKKFCSDGLKYDETAVFIDDFALA